MAKIKVSLPTNRAYLGTLTLLDGQGNIVTGPFDSLGKADSGTATLNGNPTSDPTLPFGDTPSGKYSYKGILPTGDGSGRPTSSYGTAGAIAIEPVSGAAAIAKANGRTGLRIHGGDPSSSGGLRRTNGCVRLSNADMKILVDAIAALPAPDPVDVVEISDIVSLASAVSPDDGYTEGDPPA